MIYKKGDRVRVVNLTSYCFPYTSCNCIGKLGTVINYSDDNCIFVELDKKAKCFFVEDDLTPYYSKELL